MRGLFIRGKEKQVQRGGSAFSFVASSIASSSLMLTILLFEEPTVHLLVSLYLNKENLKEEPPLIPPHNHLKSLENSRL